MFCDVVHAKSTHFNISASVQAGLPRGRVGGVGSNLGRTLLHLTEEDAFALDEAIAPRDQMQELCGQSRGNLPHTFNLQRLTWAKLACLFYV